MQARLVECLGYCCHIHKVTSLCRKGKSLFKSCHWPLSGLSDQSPPFLVIQFGGMAWSRQGLGGTICLPLLYDCFDCAPRDIEGFWNIFGPGNGSLTLTHLVVLVVVVVVVVLGLTLFEKSRRLLHFLFKFHLIIPYSLTHPLTVFDFAILFTFSIF